MVCFGGGTGSHDRIHVGQQWFLIFIVSTTSRNKTSSIASYQHDGFIVPYEFIHVVPRDSYNSLLPV